jgi:hypothetical protein
MFKHCFLVLMLVILLIVFAFLQLNDPDPFGWTLTYLSAACLCFLACQKKLAGWLAITSSVLFVGGAVFLWPHNFKGVTGTMENNPEVELARESLGLALCAVFVLTSFFLQRRK